MNKLLIVIPILCGLIHAKPSPKMTSFGSGSGDYDYYGSGSGFGTYDYYGSGFGSDLVLEPMITMDQDQDLTTMELVDLDQETMTTMDQDQDLTTMVLDQDLDLEPMTMVLVLDLLITMTTMEQVDLD